jgi:hypothetical protein
MVHSELSPSAGALEEVRRLAGASAAIQSVMRLEGGQHADTWRVDTASPELTVVVRQFPAGDSAGARDAVETWAPNYAPLGRADLTGQELRRLHSRWTARLLERT